MKILKVRNQTNALIKEEIAHLLLLRFKHLNKKWLTAQHAGSIPANIWCQTCNRFNSAHLLNTLRVVRPSGPWHYLQARLFSDDRLHLLFKLLLCPGHEPGTWQALKGTSRVQASFRWMMGICRIPWASWGKNQGLLPPYNHRTLCNK